MTTAPARPTSALMTAGAGALIIVAVLGSFAATPLFPLYSAHWGLDPTQISIAFTGYPVGVILVVTLLGGLSDLIGRRWTMLLGVALVLVAFAVTALASSLPVLVTGRVIQGMATGLVGSTTAAAMLDFHPKGIRAGSLAHAICTTLGMGLGPLVSGALAARVANPLVVPYLVIGALVLVPLTLVVRAPRDRRVGGRVRVVRPVRVPRSIWLPFSVAACSLMTLNGCMALYGTFGARILTEGVGSTSVGGTGGLMTLLIGMTLAAQVLLNRLRSTLSVCLGVFGIAIGAGVTAFGLHDTSATATLTGTALIGFGGGLTLLGATRIIGDHAPPERRAEIFAAWMTAAFATLGGTSLLTGLALRDAPLTRVMTIAAVVIAVFSAYTMVAVRRGLRARPQSPVAQPPVVTG